LDLDVIRRINDWITRGILPQLTLLLDIEPEVGLRRIAKAGKPLDRLEREDKEFHQRVREGYLELAARQPHRFRVIPAEGDAAAVGARVLEQVRLLLEE
jgi:dTMP kinase